MPYINVIESLRFINDIFNQFISFIKKFFYNDYSDLQDNKSEVIKEINLEKDLDMKAINEFIPITSLHNDFINEIVHYCNYYEINDCKSILDSKFILEQINLRLDNQNDNLQYINYYE